MVSDINYSLYDVSTIKFTLMIIRLYIKLQKCKELLILTVILNLLAVKENDNLTPLGRDAVSIEYNADCK